MKKAPIAVALVLVFGLFAAAFSLGPAVAQYTPPSDSTATSSSNSSSSTNTTSTSNNTTSTSTNATGGTFSASGSIASLIFDMGEVTTTSEVGNTTTASNDTGTTGNLTASGNATISGNTTMMPQVITGGNTSASTDLSGSANFTSSGNDTSTTSTTSNETSTAAEELEPPYILAGDWSLDVQDGNVSDFSASFTMVHTDGTMRHTHDLSNFVSSNSSTIDTSGQGTSFIFGTVDVAVNGEAKWTGADALIVIEKNNVVSISVASEDTDDHFGGQPIYGIVDSMTDESGNELVEGTTGAAGNVTQGAENAVNQTGEFLGNVTEGVKDFFNGTG